MPCFVKVLSPPARKPLTATLTPTHGPLSLGHVSRSRRLGTWRERGGVRALADEGIGGPGAVHPKLRESQRRELSKQARDKGILETRGSGYHGEGKGSSRLGLV